MGQFPLGVGISEVRGIVELVKDNGGSLSLSKLAEEAEEEIDKLLPLIDAGEMLGLCNVENGIIKLTSTGASLTLRNAPQLLSKALAGTEPFKTVIEVLSLSNSKGMTSAELASKLKGRNLVLYADDVTNVEMLRSLLLRWGVRTKLLAYYRNGDMWKLPRNH